MAPGGGGGGGLHEEISTITLEKKEKLSRSMSKITLANLPEELRSKLARFDKNGNGVLDVDEIPIADRDDAISIKAFPPAFQKSCSVFDKDGDGTVNMSELAAAAEMYENSKRTTRRLAILSTTLFFVLCLLVGVIVGLTAVVVEESKESKATSKKANGGSESATMRLKTNQSVVMAATCADPRLSTLEEVQKETVKLAEKLLIGMVPLEEKENKEADGTVGTKEGVYSFYFNEPAGARFVHPSQNSRRAGARSTPPRRDGS